MYTGTSLSKVRFEKIYTGSESNIGSGSRNVVALAGAASAPQHLIELSKTHFIITVQKMKCLLLFRLGLRGSQHDVQLAVENIERMRSERKQIRQKEKEEREREALRRYRYNTPVFRIQDPALFNPRIRVPELFSLDPRS
jgi:hypothetical protein